MLTMAKRRYTHCISCAKAFPRDQSSPYCDRLCRDKGAPKVSYQKQRHTADVDRYLQLAVELESTPPHLQEAIRRAMRELNPERG